MTIQPVFIIREWTNDIQQYFPIDTNSLDPEKKYIMLSGDPEINTESIYPGEELVYSEEFDADTLFEKCRSKGLKEITIKDGEMTFFKTKIEKIFSCGYIQKKLLVSEVNNSRLKYLILCRIINDSESKI